MAQATSFDALGWVTVVANALGIFTEKKTSHF
jgi:hypothetical protein